MLTKKLREIEYMNRALVQKSGAPKHIGNEPLFSPVLDDLFLFAELTAYPQRSALEQALTID